MTKSNIFYPSLSITKRKCFISSVGITHIYRTSKTIICFYKLNILVWKEKKCWRLFSFFHVLEIRNEMMRLPSLYQRTMGSGEPPTLEQVNSCFFPSVAVTCVPGVTVGCCGSVNTVRVYLCACKLAPEPPAFTLHSNFPLSLS